MTPLAQKLQMKPGKCWLFHHMPPGYLANLEPLPEGAEAVFTPGKAIDGIQLFVKNSDELKKGLKGLAPFFKADTIIWVIFPKKASGIPSDLDMPHSWDEPGKYNLRPVTSVGIDANWTAIRLRQHDQAKISEFGNGEIKKNEHSIYIDLEKRQVTLPPDMKELLESSPAALNFFHSLSFSNKKEYVVWILSAKQEKTRLERLSKVAEKLLAGKKNPSEK
jgi:hypothetical protein